MEKPKSNQGDNLAAVAVKSYWVALWDRAANTYSSRIVNAANAEQAQIEAVRKINVENEYGPDEDGGFLAVGAYDSVELLAFVVEMEACDKGPTSIEKDCTTKMPVAKIEPTAEPADAQYFWTLVWDSAWQVEPVALKLTKAASAEAAATMALSNFKAAHSAEEISDGEWEVTVAKVDQCTAAELRASYAGNDDSLGSENTYLVRAVTVVADYGESKRWETDKFLVLAKNAKVAYWSAMNHHIAEFFYGHQQGGLWDTDTNSQNEECLVFHPGYSEGDHGIQVSIMIEEMRKLPPEDALILKKYLAVVDDSPAPVHG